MRVGQGIDAHKFSAGDNVVLGGVRIPFEKGLAAHSDGDVLLHAVCDALLGAAAMGDIGRHFPDSSAEFEGIDSRILLRRVKELLSTNGWSIVNLDVTLIAERPKIAAHVDQMRANIGADLDLDISAINVKGTTTEKMGFTGRGEGIAATAVALIEPLL